MKALVMHGPGEYRVEHDWPDPDPKPGWAKIRVRYAGVCGSDLPRFGSAGAYHYPIILGHEFMGEVETPAAGSGRFGAGQRVAALPLIPCGRCDGCTSYGPFHCRQYQFLGSRNDGGFAEYCIVPEENLLALPEGVDPRIGAFVEPIAVALHVVRRSAFESGATALVFGAGTIGVLIAVWLRILGAGRIGIADIRQESLDAARQMGFEEAVDVGTDDLSSWPDFDFCFEAAGAGAALRKAIEKTSNQGAVTVVGRDTADIVIPLKEFETLMRKEVTLHGCWGYDLRGDEQFVTEALQREEFDVEALLSHEVSLDDAPDFLRKMVDGQVSCRKAVLRL